MAGQLFIARRMGFEEVVQALVDKGSRVNEQDRFDHTPFVMTTDKHGYEAISMCLLRAGASCEGLHQRKVDDLFHHACRKRDLSAVRALLKNGCSVRELTQEDLHYLMHNLFKQEIEELFRRACCHGHMFVARALLREACSVNILSTEEQDLLHHACRDDDAFSFTQEWLQCEEVNSRRHPLRP